VKTTTKKISVYWITFIVDATKLIKLITKNIPLPSKLKKRENDFSYFILG